MQKCILGDSVFQRLEKNKNLEKNLVPSMEYLKNIDRSSLEQVASPPLQNCPENLNAAEPNSDQGRSNLQTAQTEKPAGKKNRSRKAARVKKAAENHASKVGETEEVQSTAKVQSAKRSADDAANHAQPKKAKSSLKTNQPGKLAVLPFSPLLVARPQSPLLVAQWAQEKRPRLRAGTPEGTETEATSDEEGCPPHRFERPGEDEAFRRLGPLGLPDEEARPHPPGPQGLLDRGARPTTYLPRCQGRPGEAHASRSASGGRGRAQCAQQVQ